MPQQLSHYQRLVQAEAKKGSEWDINCGLTLKRWQDEAALPRHLSELRDERIYAVPMAASDEPPEPAVALIGKTQVLWIQQLVRNRRWALHCDGKHGLHKGKWILVTYGTHSVTLRTNAEGKSHSEQIVHRFRPLLFMISKGIEDVESLIFGCKALETVARMCAVVPHTRGMYVTCACARTCTCTCISLMYVTCSISHCRYHKDMVSGAPRSLHMQELPGASRGFLASNHASTDSSSVEGHGPVKKRRIGPLAAAFGRDLQGVVDSLRRVGAESGLDPSFTAHIVRAASTYSEQNESSWWPQLIMPGAVISDGSRGIKSAFKHWWPSVPQYGDYAHIYFLFAEGRYLEKSHPRFDYVLTEIIPEMHTCQTSGAWNVLSEFLAKTWKSDRALMKIHGQLFACEHPNPWYIGTAEVGGAMPSQNEIEVCCCAVHMYVCARACACHMCMCCACARTCTCTCTCSTHAHAHAHACCKGHAHMNMHMHMHTYTCTWQGYHHTAFARIKRFKRVPMHTVLNKTLRTLITMEGLNAPNLLDFRVCERWLPLQMYQRAHALVLDQERYILKGLKPLDGGEACYYVLSLSQTEHSKISHELVER